MKRIFFRVSQTRNYEKGGDFLSHRIAEVDAYEEAYAIAKEKTSEKLCEITIYKVNKYNIGESAVVAWRGIKA